VGQVSKLQTNITLTSCSAAPSFSEALRQGAEVYQKLKSLAKKKYGQSAGNVGDEGGVAPDIQTAEEALELISEAIESAGYTGQVHIAMDVASSEFYKADVKKYDLDFKNPDSDPTKWLTYEQLAEQYKELAKKYPIVSIEDPFAEDDWEAWSYFYKTSNFQIVGDDLTVTNPLRIKKAIELKSCNALLLKVNQIGTLTESVSISPPHEDLLEYSPPSTAVSFDEMKLIVISLRSKQRRILSRPVGV